MLEYFGLIEKRMIINKLKILLNDALISSREERILIIKEFQHGVWEDDSIEDENINDILTDAAYIFDFYEPNEEWRKEDPAYYGDERLIKEITQALQKLE